MISLCLWLWWMRSLSLLCPLKTLYRQMLNCRLRQLPLDHSKQLMKMHGLRQGIPLDLVKTHSLRQGSWTEESRNKGSLLSPLTVLQQACIQRAMGSAGMGIAALGNLAGQQRSSSTTLQLQASCLSGLKLRA